MTRTFAGWVAVAVACFVLIGCTNRKITKEYYDKIQNGMSLAEVEKLLGKGEQETGDGSNVAAQFGVAVDGGGGPKGVDTYVWEGSKTKITVTLKQGKVVGKHFSGS